MELQNGIIMDGIHWQYGTTFTHGSCEDIVLDTGIGNGSNAIKNYGTV